MAKMSYSKPSFAFHAIPAVVGGGTGCYYTTEQEPKACGIYDPDWGEWIFSGGICTIEPEDGFNFCYTVPLADNNVYNS